MSKRNKKISSKRSAFKLEALEQRQLLATISGNGTEVGSNITVNGKVYDQVLLTAAAGATSTSVTVTPDAGQIVRVDFLDTDGDIVRAEYSGSGSLTVSLANITAAATPKLYTGVTTQYVTGLASFTITGSDATSNFLTTSLGPTTAFGGAANPIFANGTTTGGNHQANVSRIVIVGDSNNLVSGVGTSFGSIFAGNAVFGDTSGLTGIYAPNTSFKSGSTITIGDIVPGSTVATPEIVVGVLSDVKTVTVAGGSLKSFSSGVGYVLQDNGGGKLGFVSTTGTKSDGTALPTQTLNQTGGGSVTYSSGLGTVTIDATTATQATLDAYKGSYLTDVVINGTLATGLVFHALQFGNVTVNGNLDALLTTDTNDNNVADSAEQGIGNVTVTGNIVDGGYIESATTIGNVTVNGGVTHTVTSGTITVNNVPGVQNAIAVISTLGKTGTLSAAIGNISVTGDINMGTSTTPIAEPFVVANRGLKTDNTVTTLGATAGIGSISAANVNAYESAVTGGLAFITSAGTSKGNIGALTFTGDVTGVFTGAGSGFIGSAASVGNISAKSLTLTSTGANNIVAGGGSVGSITTTGPIGLNLIQGGITATTSIGNIAVKTAGSFNLGASTAGVANALSTPITASGGNIGTITIDAGNFVTGSAAGITATGGNIGDITLTSGKIATGSAISASGGNVGNLNLVDTSAAGSILGAAISSTVSTSTTLGGAIGNITVTKGSLTTGAITAGTTLGNITASNGALTIGGAVTATSSIGNIAVTSGNLSVTGSVVASNTNASVGTSIGNVTVSGGAITGTSGVVTFQANQIGTVSVTGAATTPTLLTDVIFSAKGTKGATIATAKIGNITLNSSANATGDIAASAATTAAGAATDATHGTGFSSSGSIGSITITTGSGAGAEIVSGANAWDSLVFRAGSSNMGAAAGVTSAGTATTAIAAGVAVNLANSAATTDNVESVSIGDVTISAKIVGGNLSLGNIAGSGLIIASGINNTVAGSFVTAGTVTGNALTTPALSTSGTIGNLTINDLSSSVIKTPFSSPASGLVTTTATAVGGGSVIVSDKLSSITVNSGLGSILAATNLSGLPVAGVLGNGTGIPVAANQAFASNADNLFIVVL